MNPSFTLPRTQETGIASDPETLMFLWGLVHLVKPDLVVETGCDKGAASFVIGTALKQIGHGGLVTCDVNPASVEATQQLCQDLPVRVELTPALELPELPNADLIFFDSSFESRPKEMQRMKGGAIGVLHDWKAELPAFPNAVKEFSQHVFFDDVKGVAVFRRA